MNFRGDGMDPNPALCLRAQRFGHRDRLDFGMETPTRMADDNADFVLQSSDIYELIRPQGTITRTTRSPIKPEQIQALVALDFVEMLRSGPVFRATFNETKRPNSYEFHLRYFKPRL